MKSTPIARKCFPFQTGDLVPVTTRKKEYIEAHRTSNPARFRKSPDFVIYK